jgi:hypothetical protein
MAKSSFLDKSTKLDFLGDYEIRESKEKNSSAAPEFFGYLFSIRDKAHLAHLKVSGPGAFSAHMALGDFYSGILDITDELIEVYQGMYGIIDNITIPGSTYMEPVGLLDSCRTYIQTNRMKVCDESHFQNIMDNLVALIDRTLYKLENLK